MEPWICHKPLVKCGAKIKNAPIVIIHWHAFGPVCVQSGLKSNYPAAAFVEWLNVGIKDKLLLCCQCSITRSICSWYNMNEGPNEVVLIVVIFGFFTKNQICYTLTTACSLGHISLSDCMLKLNVDIMSGREVLSCIL